MSVNSIIRGMDKDRARIQRRKDRINRRKQAKEARDKMIDEILHLLSKSQEIDDVIDDIRKLKELYNE